MAELADALDLGSSAFGRVGSSPTRRTILTEDPPKPGSVRLPGHQGILLLQWFWTLAWGGVKRCQHASKGPTSQRRRPPTIFSLLWLGAFRHAWSVSRNQTPVAQCRALRWGSILPRFRRKEHLINESFSRRRGGAGCSLVSGVNPCRIVRFPVADGLLVWGCVDRGSQQPFRV